MKYKELRALYYIGILFLVIYALPKIGFVNKYIYPVLQYEIITGLPIISMIALMMSIAAFVAYKYRTIG